MKLKDYKVQEFYKAHLARDPRFDGKFFVAVKTTKIYCRPTCPARKAKLQNLEFYIHAEQAQAAGYRPCLRCRPESAPGSAAWVGTSATIKRALRLMDSFALDEITISQLANKLGIGEHWLCELFQKQIGASPHKILLSKKLNLARNLLDSTTLSIMDIAFSSGFKSIRRFNDAFKLRFNTTPSAIRHTNKLQQQKLHLSYRPPYAWDRLIKFFSNRTITEVEKVEDNSYQRLIAYGDIRGWFRATLVTKNKLAIEFKFNKNANLLEFISRIKNIFDLDCDPMAIASTFATDQKLRPYLINNSGLRIPGCWDGFELSIRAIVGQKISVKAAHTVLAKIVQNCGEINTFDNLPGLTRFFPTPEQILAANLSNTGLTTAKITSIKNLALEIVNKNIVLDGSADLEDTRQKLLAIKGIGEWTVEYICMRALGNPNAFPHTDLELQKKIKALALEPDKWVPWRGYAAILLWNLNIGAVDPLMDYNKKEILVSQEK